MTEGPVSAKLIALTTPMVFAMLSMVVFNLVDTYFVSRLGTEELAAMGFTFPVVMFVTGIALGFGVATSSVVSRAIGRQDGHQVRRLTTDALVVSVLIVICVAIAGLLSMDWLFRLQGAQGRTLALVKEYMGIWFLGVAFVVIPMVGNNAIRATGDTLVPSLIMITSMAVNVVLDPLMIFGLWGFPRMELRGAALATVIARAVSLVCSLLVLHFRERLLDFTRPSLKEVVSSVKEILFIGLPTATSRLLMPLTMAVIMRFVAAFGEPAVAAFGVAVKVEMFVFIVVMALASAVIPFIGQNWGAGHKDRVNEAVAKANRFSIFYGLGFFVVFLVLAEPLGRIFGKEAAVSMNIMRFLLIVPVSYGLRGSTFLIASAFNAINKPFVATGVNLVRMFVFYIPLAIVGSRVAGLEGLFAGLCLANVLAGVLSLFLARSFFG